MCSRRCLAACMGLVLLMGGCGDSESPGSSDSGATPAAAERPVAKASELVGVWYQASEANDFLGMEFGSDGKVMVSAALNVTRTWDYSVMEGGRVRMIVPGGETIVFKCAVDRRSLVLDPESPGMVSRNQFVRLENQTLAEAHRARQQEAAKQQEAMLEQVRELVKRPNLVLESSDPSLRLSRYALELKGGPDQFEGVAWTESNPPVMRQAGLWVQQGRPPQVLIVLGSVLGPPGEADRQHIQIRLTPRGEGSKLELEEKGLALRSNEKVHAEIVKGYDTIIAEREAALAKALEPFGAYARFETEFYTSNAPNARPVPAKFALWRVKGKPQFRVADLRRKSNPAEAQFNMTADAIVYAGKLLVSCPQMQFEMEPVSAGGKLALKGGFGGWEVQVPAVEVLSEAELKERAEAVKAFVDRDLARGMTLRGWMVSDRDHIKNLHQPLSLVMKCDAQHKLSGTLKMLSHSSEFEMQGDITPAMTGACHEQHEARAEPAKAVQPDGVSGRQRQSRRALAGRASDLQRHQRRSVRRRPGRI
jgi:hypothetical protein